MEENKQNVRLCETEPYIAVAKTVLETAVEDGLELPELLRAIRTAFLDKAIQKCEKIQCDINELDARYKAADTEVTALRRE